MKITSVSPEGQGHRGQPDEENITIFPVRPYP